jgi:hypothetical protein
MSTDSLSTNAPPHDRCRNSCRGGVGVKQL